MKLALCVCESYFFTFRDGLDENCFVELETLHFLRQNVKEESCFYESGTSQ